MKEFYGIYENVPQDYDSLKSSLEAIRGTLATQLTLGGVWNGLWLKKDLNEINRALESGDIEKMQECINSYGHLEQ